MVSVMAHISKPTALNEWLEGCLTGTAQLLQNLNNLAKENPRKDFLTAMEMNHELNALKLTLNQQELGTQIELKTTVLNQIKDLNFSNSAMSKWAKDIIKFISSVKDEEMKDHKEADLTLEYSNEMGLAFFDGPSGVRINIAGKDFSPSRKRAMLSWLYGSSRNPEIRIEEVVETHDLMDSAQELTNFGQEILIPKEEADTTTPRRSFVLKNEVNIERICTISWKREARRQNI